MEYERLVYVCDQCKTESENVPGYPGRQAGEGWLVLTKKSCGYGSMDKTMHLCSDKCLCAYVEQKHRPAPNPSIQ